jgi:probable rRNA maturation factor
VQVSVLLTTDMHIADLNREYRSVDQPTDVLAFPQFEGENGAMAGGTLGDVVVSVERGYEQASEAGRRPETEICELVAHGVLHLMGFRDDTPDGQQAMRKRQRAMLAGLGLGEEG